MTGPASAFNLARTRAWADVDLDALAHNARVVRARLPAATALMAVVKADAYGHGLVPAAEAAVAGGATWLGVGTPEEALDLHAAGIPARILLLAPAPRPWLPALARAGCTLTVTDRATLEAVGDLPGYARPPVHIKVDTGMTRLGATVEALPDLLHQARMMGLPVEGLFTHLACADEPSHAATAEQLAVFERAVRLTRDSHPGVLCHAAASAAVVAFPEAAFDIVRAGIVLYGVQPSPHVALPGLRPVMALWARVVRTRRVPAGTPVSYGATYRSPRPTVIATVPVGYADGYPRGLGNAGVMVVGGQRHPVAGRVCMDYTMLDVGDATVREGDGVMVFGPGLSLEEVAATAGTIPYDLLCRLGPRVPRIYLRAGVPVAAASGGLRAAARIPEPTSLEVR